MRIIEAPQTKNDCYKQAKPMTPVGILIHSTAANNKNLNRYVDAPAELGKNRYENHWNQPNFRKCMHAFVGIDINKSLAVAHTLPYTVASWGCGSGKKGSYNRDPTGHIQFEICEDGRTDANYYHDVFALVEDYCVYLCKMFGFTEKNITSHYEAHSLGYASNHGDPRHWMILFGDSMDKFRARVAARLAVEGGEITAPQEEMESDDKMSLSGWNVRVDTKLPAGLNLWSTKIATNRDSLKKVSKGSIMKCLQDHEDGWATCEFEGVTGFADMKYLTTTSKFETVPAPVPVEQDTVSKDEILRGLVVIQQGIDVIRKAIA